MGRQWLAVAAKAAVSVLLLAVLLQRIDIAPMAARLAKLDVVVAALAVAIVAVQLCIAAQRWRLVARMVDVALRSDTALRIMFIGQFFNQTLPSAIGGDAIRIWLVTRENIALGKAVSAVLCDWVFALFVLIGLIGGSLPLLYGRVGDVAARSGMTMLVAAAAVAMAIFLILGEALASFFARWRFTRPLGTLAADFRRLLEAPAATAGLVGQSLVVHVLTVAAVYELARALDVAVPFADCLVITPPVILATMLPISVAGWGVRESAMVVGFGLVGIAAVDALALSVCFGLAQIMVGLPGGVLWLRGRRINDDSG
ncbi:MAG: flippase-like domain-containing protein [Proteobacteria bacterium]|nr:flippase-like domain-containing protein [Pseudomonadota bacterium]